MGCLSCSLLKTAQKKNEELRRSRNVTFLVLEVVAGMAKNYRRKLLQHMGPDIIQDDFDFDELLEKLRDWNADTENIQAAADLVTKALEITAHEK